MLAILNAINKGYYTVIFEADLRYWNADLLFTQTGERKVDLILANNVFHWLFNEKAVETAFRECYEILDRNGGCLAASIAALGTGSDFLKAYHAELDETLDQPERDKWQRHLKNPIGLQALDSIVNIARRCRFKIVHAQQIYEPKKFDSTDAYVADARAYGEEVFMAPLLTRPIAQQAEVWERISRRFRDLYTAKFNQVSYLHDQFMIYLIAVRHD
jgi:hypothetical protein